MSKMTLLILLVALLLVGLAPAALAGHAHWIDTPGTCLEDVGSGQTSISDPSHGGYHRFHDNVHLGVPGTFAFDQGGQVSVGKGTCP